MTSTPLPYLLAATLALGCGGDLAGSPPGGNTGFGGAQDIGQFRDLLDRGEIPSSATLDANGFFSEHFIELPPPDCGGELCAHGMLSVGSSWTDGSYQAALQIAINTPRDPAELERPPLDLVVVIDESGSMLDDDRLAYVKDGLHLLIDELVDGDRVALVAYDDGSRIAAGFTEDRAQLHEVVDELVAGGGTNIYAGLETGFELASEGVDAARQRRVILLSDGLATAGETSSEAIIAMASAHIESGVGLTTIGVGDQFNVELMRGLAEHGAGNFYYVEDAAAVTEVFTREADYAMVPIALGVSVDVEMAPGYELGEVTGTRLWKTTGPSGTMYVPALFLASRTADDPGEGGRRGGGSALFIDAIPTGEATDGAAIATLRLRYRRPGETELIDELVTIENPHAAEAPEEPYFSHLATAKGYAMYNLYLGLALAADEARYDYGCALDVLENLQQRAGLWNADYRDPDIAADLELIESFAANLVEHGAAECDPARIPRDRDHVYRGCAAGGAAGGGLWLVLLAFAGGALRRLAGARARDRRCPAPGPPRREPGRRSGCSACGCDRGR